MKKIFALLLTAALAVTLFAACTPKEPAEKTPEVTNPTTVAEEVPQGTQVTPAGMSLEALVTEANANSAGMYTAKLDGKKLIYVFTDVSGMMTAATVQPALDAMEGAYGSFVSSWKDAGYDIDALVLQYVDQSGKVLGEKEFK